MLAQKRIQIVFKNILIIFFIFRTVPLFSGNSNPVLGEILGLLVHGRCGRHSYCDSSIDYVRTIRGAFLSFASRLQMQHVR